MRIIPAILTNSFESIQSLVESVAETTDIVHVDICDGLFVQSKTWPYSGNKTGNPADNMQMKRLLSEETGMPSWQKLDYQFDLMIRNPQETLDLWMRAGADSVLLHPTSFDSVETCIETARAANSGLFGLGLAVTYDEWMTHREVLTAALTEGVFGIFQAMTIKRIGDQGEPFDARWLPELAAIKAAFPSVSLQVDGGIGEDTVDDVIDSGVDAAVIGSAIFKEGNATENLEYFKSL